MSDQGFETEINDRSKKSRAVNALLLNLYADPSIVADVTQTSTEFINQIRRRIESGEISEVELVEQADKSLQLKYRNTLSKNTVEQSELELRVERPEIKEFVETHQPLSVVEFHREFGTLPKKTVIVNSLLFDPELSPKPIAQAARSSREFVRQVRKEFAASHLSDEIEQLRDLKLVERLASVYDELGVSHIDIEDSSDVVADMWWRHLANLWLIDQDISAKIASSFIGCPETYAEEVFDSLDKQTSFAESVHSKVLQRHYTKRLGKELALLEEKSAWKSGSDTEIEETGDDLLSLPKQSQPPVQSDQMISATEIARLRSELEFIRRIAQGRIEADDSEEAKGEFVVANEVIQRLDALLKSSE